MEKRLATVCMGLAMLVSLFACALIGFEEVATDEGQYIALEDKFDLYDDIGVSREEMTPALADLAAYIRGETEVYNRDVTMFGEDKPLFNEKELTHMADVLALFRLERSVRTACLILAAALALCGLWLARGDRLRALKHGLVLALALLAVLTAGCAAAYVMIGFEDIFIGFHHLFFTNDLWQMYYSEDAMIRMFPAEFFETLLHLILLRMGTRTLECAAVWTGLWGAATLVKRKRTSI